MKMPTMRRCPTLILGLKHWFLVVRQLAVLRQLPQAQLEEEVLA